MCRGSKSELVPSNFTMVAELEEHRVGGICKSSVLLELAASNDVLDFKTEVEEKGLDLGEASLWYGRTIWSKKMGFEERTPLMIAAMFGSVDVSKYIVGSGEIDVNVACGTDGFTALHCAVAGGSDSSVEIVELLLDAYADANRVDANGNTPFDLVVQGLRTLSSSRRKAIELMLKGESETMVMPQFEKKEYPVYASLPDINNGVYGTDEFRMFTFKVKPCSRAYSHDWTECPFVHPGENARRRDPRKYSYSCVPCPEFRKGACSKSDACEYAHGIFESWLHPSQYRTKLCKDEIGCARKVCFFAHKREELRPVYASTGSAMPSPRSGAIDESDMANLSPLALGSCSSPMATPSTPPMSPKIGGLWHNNLTPPALQLHGSRLKTALSARDFDLEMQLLALENHASQYQQQQLMDEISSLSSPSFRSNDHNRLGNLMPTNLDDAFGSLDPCRSQSPIRLHVRQNMNKLRASHPSNLSSSTIRSPSAYGFDSSAAVAAAVMNSRSSAFAKRSQSFIDRGSMTGHAGLAANSTTMMPSNISDWSSPDGKLDWGIQRGNELNKLRKHASFGFRSNNHASPPPPAATTNMMAPTAGEPDVSWVHSLVKDVSPIGVGLRQQQRQHRYGLDGGVRETLPPWMVQMYIEQEQMA